MPAAGAARGLPLLSVEDLRVQFHTDHGVVKAADGVSFSVWPEEVLGIVGESGSGKTVSALSLLRLLPATAKVTGTVTFGGRDVLRLPAAELRAIRGDRVGLVFQDALAALNPFTGSGSRSPKRSGSITRRRPARRRAGGRSSCSASSGSPRRRPGPASTRTSSRAACASGR